MEAARRKEELERKKQKLADMRAEKGKTATPAPKAEGDGSSLRNLDHDKLLESLGISTAASPAKQHMDAEMKRDGLTNGDVQKDSVMSNGITSNQRHVASIGVGTDLSIGLDVPSVAVLTTEKQQETVAYNKETQTSGLERTEHPSGIHDYYDPVFVEGPSFEWDEEFPVLSYGEGEATDDFSKEMDDVYTHRSVIRALQNFPKGDAGHNGAPLPQHSVEEDHGHNLPDMTAEQKQEVMLTEDFKRFFDKASRVIERALAEEDAGTDIFIDYKGENLDTLGGNDSNDIKVKPLRVFADEKSTSGRGISCLGISPHFSELVIASYHNPEEYSTEPGGLASLWNLRFKKSTPEDIFRCHSALTAVSFADFHPNLLIGGTYSGQIVVWDNRVNKRTPINKSQVAVSTHCHPIFFSRIMGSSHAHNLVTASSDGRICSWSLDMLSQPQEFLDLTNKGQTKIPIACLSFPMDNWNNFLAGAEEGVVFAGQRHGNKPGVVDMYEGHFGPVTSVAYHPSHDTSEFSHLFLTSSYDWTVKLWSVKERKPVYSFEAFGDNVYDVKWSPVNPAVFATVDGTGTLDFWNLNQETEIPVLRVPIEGAPSASRLLWTPNGQQVLVGDNSGKLHVFDVKEVSGLRADDQQQLDRTIQELRQRTQVTEEAEAASAQVASTHSLLDRLALS